MAPLPAAPATDRFKTPMLLGITAAVLVATLLGLALSACADRPSRAEPAPSEAVTATPGPGAGARASTDGRLGDAVTATARTPEDVVLGRGGKIPYGVAEAPRGRVGVGSEPPCADPEIEPARGNIARVARALLCLMNAERRERGLPALKPQGRLGRASTRHSRDMVARGYFAHDSPSGAGLVDRLRAVRYIPRDRSWTVGENLAWGSGALARPGAIVQAWMDSPPHRKNLLSAGYSSVGLGIAIGTPTSAVGGATFTTDFGRIRPTGAAR